MYRVKGKLMLHFVVAGASFGIGMWNSHKEDGFSGLLAAMWFAVAATNVYYFLEA